MTLSRTVLIALTILFAIYQLALGIYDLGRAVSPIPTFIAMGIYLVTVIVCILPIGGIRMPIPLAIVALVVSMLLPILVTSQLVGGDDHGYATWYVASCGTLLAIMAARRRPWLAWLGIAFLAVYTVAWDGPAAIVTTGVVGSIAWVGVAAALVRALQAASRETTSLIVAGREAVQWQAAQDAHLYERRDRLAQTSRLAGPMLRRIVDRGGDLNEQQRQECRRLEAVLRDEIRGRALLDDGVREAVRAARHRGASVMLLDEGTLDDLSEPELSRVHSELATAIRGSLADRIIVRTAAEGTSIAVTVVGLRSADATGISALGDEESDDDIEMWLEIAR